MSFSDLQRTIVRLYDECQRQTAQLPSRLPLFSYSQENFHPPSNVSGIVDVADLEVAILLVDLLTMKHENNELRWSKQRLINENQVLKSKVDLYELTNRYFQKDIEILPDDNRYENLRSREKKLRLYVFRLYELLQTTSTQLNEQENYYETLIYQYRKRHQQISEQCRQIRHEVNHIV